MVCVQYHNYTGCTAQILVRTQPCGIWAVRTCQLDHVTSTGIIAHATGGKIYAKYPKVKQQVEDSVKADIMKLGKVNAPTWEIADHVSESSDNVAAKYDENMKVRVLLVQTQTQFDTTFGTNKEEYKLYLPPYVSVVTGETE